MEKGKYQKLKLLYLLEILRDYSDENTYFTIDGLIAVERRAGAVFCFDKV